MSNPQPAEESWETADQDPNLLQKGLPRTSFDDEDRPTEVPIVPSKPAKIEPESEPKPEPAKVSHKKKKEKQAKEQKAEAKAVEEEKKGEGKVEKAGKVIVILPMTLPGSAGTLYKEVFKRMDKYCDVKLLDHNHIRRDANETYPGKGAECKRTRYYEEEFRGMMTQYFTMPLDARKVRIVFIDKIHVPEAIEKTLRECKGVRTQKDVEYVYIGLAPKCPSRIKGYPFSYSHVLYSLLSQHARVGHTIKDSNLQDSALIQLKFTRLYEHFVSWQKIEEKYELDDIIEFETESKSEDANLAPEIKTTIDTMLKNLTGKEQAAMQRQVKGYDKLQTFPWVQLKKKRKENEEEFMPQIIMQICGQIADIAGVNPGKDPSGVPLFTYEVLYQYNLASAVAAPKASSSGSEDEDEGKDEDEVEHCDGVLGKAML